jgi:hypothetical protein
MILEVEPRAAVHRDRHLVRHALTDHRRATVSLAARALSLTGRSSRQPRLPTLRHRVGHHRHRGLLVTWGSG